MKKTQQQISNSPTTGLIQSLVITSDPQYPWTDCTDGSSFQPCSIRNVSPCSFSPPSSEDRATRRRRSEALIREQYENINSYTEHPNRINRPSAVIINGDITEFGHNDIWHPERQWDTMNGLFRVLRRPYYYGLGNHDIENNFGHCQGNNCFAASIESLIRHIRPRLPANLFDYRREGVRYAGSFAYVVNFGRICSIQLHNDPTMEARTLSINLHANLPWVSNRLRRARDEGRIIIVNIHQTRGLTPEYTNLFREVGVAAIFSGHIHAFLGRMGSVGNIPLFYSGSASQRTYLTLEHYPNELRIFSVRCNDWQGHRQLVQTIPIPPPQFPAEIQIVTALNNSSVLDLNEDNNNVTLWSNHRGLNQRWAIQHISGNAYRILSRILSATGLFLTGDVYRPNSNVFLAPSTGLPEQSWLMEESGDGYIFKNQRNPNLVLDVAGGRTNNGTNLILSTRHNGNNQRFFIRSI
ncbi:RICIN domain-containing protein [Bacillus cereus]|uniref:RICIN domain-containing protein n=1 Tax=Bacillus cereus TaxID=1396 RepID=UPI00301303A6